MRREFIAGGNFSGRSEALRTELARAPAAGQQAFFLGPYAEAALSGLSSTVADEIAIYARDGEHAAFTRLDWAGLGARKPATLSGGEQVLLALHCFSRSAYREIGIDTALEQLDAPNRAAALAYLGGAEPFDVVLIDNRLDRVPPAWTQRHAVAATCDYACDLAAMIDELRPREAPVIALHDVDFGYTAERAIFRDVELSLEPGQAYRLHGPNGAGKTTLFKILVGVLNPARGTILLDGKPYRPRRDGNRVFALATQNPDHQWCGATLAEDVARRRRALAGRREITVPPDALLVSLARKLGISAPDQHLYELPLAARKRLSWLWPFSGAMPWIMLDEPTIGQDRDTRAGLALVVRHLCKIGYGVIIVTHDEAFAAALPHRPLHITGMAIRPG